MQTPSPAVDQRLQAAGTCPSCKDRRSTVRRDSAGTARRVPCPACVGSPHPSRNAPHCKDCLHYGQGNCTHPAAPVDLVTGEPAEAAGFMRMAMHQVDGPCGAEGRLFEPLQLPSAKP